MNPSFSTGATFNTGEPPPGQCPRYADDEGKGEDKDKEMHDNIPGDTDGPHGSDEDEDELPHTWKTSEFWNYVYSKLEELSDEICDILPEKNLQDEKFTEYVSCHCLHNPTDLSL